MDKLVAMLRSAGDPTRLRLLLLLRQAELTVSELIEIVGQSQPRVSRHLKLLCGAGLIERFKEGSWVFYRAADEGQGEVFGATLSRLAAGPHQTDVKRLAAVRERRAAEAAAYFKANASEWGRIRALHAPEKDVEDAIVRHLGAAPIEQLLDAGTGTGRMLELLAPQVKRAVGVDVSPEMLAIARDRLMRGNLPHCQVRLADTYRLPFPAGGTLSGVDAVLFHQVLHYLDDPGAAVAEAARVMRAGGRLLIADFAQHELEFLREDYAHRRLGFSDKEVQGWFSAAGLKPVAVEAIAPHVHSKEKLTVKIWVAQVPAKSRAEAA
ncbi:MAG: metalloregulator ArsR/SmtB family transcription factor [Alphaproteobacteria bacterium]|nr:metalloregulator ArsR/SmtB family transcription factor [Alphaproteobacteria bacterium]MDE2111568.1 metalloregulator ArsR/SmtB family transcription factor [Alphaproteobacteria bacterium]MDE2495012.1 metalloregulator ArsR/SmtB family transcription factor [Alphaproteobacteria bacterium]